MRKIAKGTLITLMVCSLFIAPISACAYAAEKTADRTYRLPDFGASVFSPDELLMRDYDMNGASYDVYGYTFEKSTGTLVSVSLWTYQAKAESAGFRWSKMEYLSTDNTINVGECWYEISCDAGSAYLCCTGSYFSTSCTATLYVPDSFDFSLEEDVSYKYSFQNEIYVDSNLISTSLQKKACHSYLPTPDARASTLTAWRGICSLWRSSKGERTENMGIFDKLKNKAGNSFDADRVVGTI